MNQDHIFLDISHVDREITAIAVVRTDRRGREVIATFSEQVTEKHTLPVILAAMQKRILSPEFGSVYVVISHYAETDRQLLRENGVTDLFTGRAWLDPSQIAWPFVYHDLAADRSLDSLCAYFQVSNPDPDTATGNCEALVKVYWAMMNRTKLALTGEEFARELAGNHLQKAFSFLGF